MTPVRPDELRLYELFVRYWDNTLSPAEVAELGEWLATDPQAREQFRSFTLQAVVAAELPRTVPDSSPLDVAPEPPCVPASLVPPETKSNTKRVLSRRRVFQYLGGGLAAAVGGVALGRWLWGGSSDDQVRLTIAQGNVRVRGPEGQLLPSRGTIPSGAMVSTEGLGAAAILAYPNGSVVSLIGDAAATVSSGEFRLHRGTASAELRPEANAAARLTLSTSLVTMPAVSSALLTLGQGQGATEVEVQAGTVAVDTPAGEPLAVVRSGELLIVGADGNRRQQATPAPPAAFAWDNAHPFPEGWPVCEREGTLEGAVLRTVPWADPYYNYAMMYQVRSDQPWTRGFFQLEENSVIRVRYRANRESPRGQLCFCVRTPQSRCPDTGMLEYNGGFKATPPDTWGWLQVRVADMLPNKHTPKFGSPWIAFLIIFNTYEEDVGLEIAEFRVSPPGPNPA